MSNLNECLCTVANVQTAQPCNAILCNDIIRVIPARGDRRIRMQSGNNLGMKHFIAVFILRGVGRVHSKD